MRKYRWIWTADIHYRPIRPTPMLYPIQISRGYDSLYTYCICISMWHSHLNDMEIPETKGFIPKGFEWGTALS